MSGVELERRPRMKILAWLLVPLLAVACASAPATPAEFSPRKYTREEVAHILAMRENGESLAAVAAEVGGTRHSVRLAERQELARRRQLRTAPTHSTALAKH